MKEIKINKEISKEKNILKKFNTTFPKKEKDKKEKDVK